MNDSARPLLCLSASDVEATGLDMAEAIETVSQVLAMHARGQVNLPSKVILDMDERRHGRINAMPAHVRGGIDACGIKWIAGFPGNPARHGLPRASAVVILNDTETGIPQCIMEASRISALRTGAVTGVGARHLARPGATNAGIIGAGVQSRTQIEALRTVLTDLAEVRVFDVRREAVERFVAWAADRHHGLRVAVADTAEDAVRGADCVVTATVADEPIVRAAWLKEGVLFAHVGSYQEEEEQVILQADKIVVDVWEEVLHRRTPLLARMHEAGTIDRTRIHADIGEIILGDKPGRETDDERIFFSPLGLGSEDIAVAAAVYRRATEMGLGVRVPFGSA